MCRKVGCKQRIPLCEVVSPDLSGKVNLIFTKGWIKENLDEFSLKLEVGEADYSPCVLNETVY